MRGEEQTHLLVDGQEVDVRLLHWQQEDEGVALIADAGRAATSVHECAEAEKARKKEKCLHCETNKLNQLM